jgi:hypothetical protein
MTLFVPVVNDPPDTSQFPDTLKEPDGATRTPEDNVRSPTATFPKDPMNIPPLTLNPLSNVCVAVEA